MRWLLMISLLFLSACATTHFGVSEDVWERMSEAERMETIRGYNERNRLRQEAAQREAEARRVAEREAALAREVRVREIHEGGGRPGDLIRVSLRDGAMRLGGKHRDYTPLAFSLASGEELRLEVLSTDAHNRAYRGQLSVAYEDGLLLIDPGSNTRDTRAARLTYEPNWRHGVRYLVDTSGPLQLREVEVLVSTVPNAGVRREPYPPRY